MITPRRPHQPLPSPWDHFSPEPALPLVGTCQFCGYLGLCHPVGTRARPRQICEECLAEAAARIRSDPSAHPMLPIEPLRKPPGREVPAAPAQPTRKPARRA